MFPEVLNRDPFVGLRSAFAMACLQLGLGFDEVGRDRLAGLMVSIAEGGEGDPDIIRARAVHWTQPSAVEPMRAI